MGLKEWADSLSAGVDDWRRENIDPTTQGMQQVAAQIAQDTRQKFDEQTGYMTAAGDLEQAADEASPEMKQWIMEHGGEFIEDHPMMAPLIGGMIAAGPLAGPVGGAIASSAPAQTAMGIATTQAPRISRFIDSATQKLDRIGKSPAFKFFESTGPYSESGPIAPAAKVLKAGVEAGASIMDDGIENIKLPGGIGATAIKNIKSAAKDLTLEDLKRNMILFGGGAPGYGPGLGPKF